MLSFTVWLLTFCKVWCSALDNRTVLAYEAEVCHCIPLMLEDVVIQLRMRQCIQVMLPHTATCMNLKDIRSVIPSLAFSTLDSKATQIPNSLHHLAALQSPLSILGFSDALLTRGGITLLSRLINVEFVKLFLLPTLGANLL